MRKSEALALYVEDIDIFNKTVTIGKTIALDEFDKVVMQTPKMTSSYRMISLDDEMLVILRKWINIMREDFLKLGFNTSKKKQLLFPNAYNKPYYTQAINDWLDWIYKKAKKEGYGFRHTACSLMFEAGASINEVQKKTWPQRR